MISNGNLASLPKNNLYGVSLVVSHTLVLRYMPTVLQQQPLYRLGQCYLVPGETFLLHYWRGCRRGCWSPVSHYLYLSFSIKPFQVLFLNSVPLSLCICNGVQYLQITSLYNTAVTSLASFVFNREHWANLLNAS